MSITITIAERPSGEVEVHIKQSSGYVTTREGRYADEIVASIKDHLKIAMPIIVKRILNSESQ